MAVEFDSGCTPDLSGKFELEKLVAFCKAAFEQNIGISWGKDYSQPIQMGDFVSSSLNLRTEGIQRVVDQALNLQAGKEVSALVGTKMDGGATATSAVAAPVATSATGTNTDAAADLVEGNTTSTTGAAGTPAGGGKKTDDASTLLVPSQPAPGPASSQLSDEQVGNIPDENADVNLPVRRTKLAIGNEVIVLNSAALWYRGKKATVVDVKKMMVKLEFVDGTMTEGNNELWLSKKNVRRII